MGLPVAANDSSVTTIANQYGNPLRINWIILVTPCTCNILAYHSVITRPQGNNIFNTSLEGFTGSVVES